MVGCTEPPRMPSPLTNNGTLVIMLFPLLWLL